MSKYIERVGGIEQAKEIVHYHRTYFSKSTHFDSVKRVFCKAQKDHGNKDLVFMNFLISEVRKLEL